MQNDSRRENGFFENRKIPPEKDPDAAKILWNKFLKQKMVFYHDTMSELSQLHVGVQGTLERLSNKNQQERNPTQRFADEQRLVSEEFEDISDLPEETQSRLEAIEQITPSEVSEFEDLPVEVQEVVEGVQEMRDAVGGQQTDPLQTLEETQELIGRIRGGDLGNNDLDTEVTPGTVDSYEILTYFTLASAVIEQRSTELLLEVLINDEYYESNSVQTFIERMNQFQREDLLLDLGIIDGELKSDMQEVRGQRNDFVHDPFARYYLDPDRLSEKAHKADRVARELDRLLKDELQDDSVSLDFWKFVHNPQPPVREMDEETET